MYKEMLICLICRFTNGARVQIGGAGTGARRIAADVQPHSGTRCISAESPTRQRAGAETGGRRGSASAPTGH